MSLGIALNVQYDNVVVDHLRAFYLFGSSTLSTTGVVSQTFKISASASDEAVTLQSITADKTKFVIIEDLSGGTTLSCKINGGSVALGARLLVLSEDLNSITFSNSDTENAIYVRIIRGKI